MSRAPTPLYLLVGVLSLTHPKCPELLSLEPLCLAHISPYQDNSSFLALPHPQRVEVGAGAAF